MDATADKAFAKAARRLVPFLGFCYFIAFVDRVNVGFAALQMNADLNLSPQAFGFGAGIFFLTYAVLEVPSNIILERVGARRWIFRIMLSWGVLSAATAFVWNDISFYALRFLLGAAEAGFFPGIIFYLACWFPADFRARMVASFMAAVPLAGIFGAPLSGFILQMHGFAGIAGWKWLFLIEGVPAIIMAFAVLIWLPDGPMDARWLSAAERDAIADRLKREPQALHHRFAPALVDLRVWLLAAAYFGIVLSLYGLGFWLPQIVHQMGFSSLRTGLIVAFPYLLAAGGMVAWGRRSDRRKERIVHFVLPALLVAAGFAIATWANGNGLIFAALTLATIGIYACFGPFWTVPADFLSGPAAAAGIALINCVGNLGGFAGPWILGAVKETTGSYAAGLALFAVAAIIAILAMVAAGRLAPKRLAADKLA